MDLSPYQVQLYRGSAILVEPEAAGADFFGVLFRLINLRSDDLEDAIRHTLTGTGVLVIGGNVLISGGTVCELRVGVGIGGGR